MNECCGPERSFGNIEGLLTVDERGQMVLPKDIREKAGIRPGDRLALVTARRDNKICCLFLIKTDELAGLVKNMMGPVLQDIIK